jgi:DNA-binding NarL/FixJ family response regulator
MVTRTAVQHGDRFIRTGLALVLNREPDIEVVGEAATAADLVSLCAATRPDAVLLEMDTDAWDAPRLVAALRKRQRTLRCVGLHDSMQPESARRAYQAGVRATVPYGNGTDAIIAALRGRLSSRSVTTSLPTTGPATKDRLTPREIDVLRRIAAGMITREIAHELGVTVKTVENHKQRIFRKLDVQNQAHAVSIAIRRGFLTPVAIAGRA